MSHQPNILILIPHDLGCFAGCYGDPAAPTPRLDQLAADGVLCEQCFTPCPECSPSRACMYTGYMPHQNGIMGLSNFGWSLQKKHLAQHLQDAGYQTHLFGLQHEHQGPASAIGYQQHHQGANARVEIVCAELESFLGEDHSNAEPWFACAGFFHVHRPFAKLSDSQFASDDVHVPDWLPDHEVVRMDLARFYQDISELDTAVGNVLDALDSSGQRDNTLVLFTTDHGAAFPGAKASLYDPGIQVPLIWHWPGQIDGGRRINDLVSNMDVCPTLLEIAGANTDHEAPAQSLVAALRGEAHTARDSVGGALFYDVAYDPMHYLRTDRYKYIRSFAADRTLQLDCQSSFAGGPWIRVDDFDVLTSPSWQALQNELPGQVHSEELYDLQRDPCERHNRCSDPDYQDILHDMRARMHRMMTETDSPLLHGHVTAPVKQQQAFASHAVGGQRYQEHVMKRQDLLC